MIRFILALLAVTLVAWLPTPGEAQQYALVPTTPRVENVSTGSYRRQMDQLEVTLPWTVTFSLVVNGQSTPGPVGTEARVLLDGQPLPGCDWGPPPRTCTITTVPTTNAAGLPYGNHVLWPELRGTTIVPLREGLLFGTGPVVSTETPQAIWVMLTLHDQINGGYWSSIPPQQMTWPGHMPTWPLVRHPPRRIAAPWDPLADPKGLLTWVENLGPTGRGALQRQPHRCAGGRICPATYQTYHHYDRRSLSVRLVDGPAGHSGHLWWIWQDPDDAAMPTVPASGHGPLPSYFVSTIYVGSMNGALAVIHPHTRRRATIVGWRNPTADEFPPAGQPLPLSQRMVDLPYKPGVRVVGNPQLVGDFSRVPTPQNLGQTTGFAPIGRKAAGAGHIDRFTIVDYQRDRILHADHAPAHTPGGQAVVTLLAQLPPKTAPYGIAAHDVDRDGPWKAWQVFTTLTRPTLQAVNVETGEVRLLAESAVPWTFGQRPGWPVDESNEAWEKNAIFPIADLATTIVPGGPGTWQWSFGASIHIFEGRAYVMCFYSGVLISFGLDMVDGKPVATDMRKEIGPIWKQGAGNYRERAFGIGRVGGRVTVAATTWGPGVGILFAKNDAGSWQWAGMLGNADVNVASAEKMVTRGVRRNMLEADYQFAAWVGHNQIIWGSTGTGPFVVTAKLPTDPVLDPTRYLRGRSLWTSAFSLVYGENVGRGEAPPDAEIAALKLTASDEAALRYFITWSLTDASSGAGGAPPSEPPPPPPPPDFLLTTTTAGTGKGEVAGGGRYTAGQTVTLVATPATGSIFVGWSPAPCAGTFAMPAGDLACVGTFAVVPPPPPPPPTLFLLTVTATGQGTVSGGGSYAAGTVVAPGAVPASGWQMSTWSPADCASPFPMPAAPKTCAAVFTEVPPPDVDIKLGPTIKYRIQGGVLVP